MGRMPSKDSISRLCLGGEIVKVPSLIVQMVQIFIIIVFVPSEMIHLEQLL